MGITGSGSFRERACGEAILYNARERRRLWSSLPGRWVMTAPIVNIAIISGLADGLLPGWLPVGISVGVLAAI